NRRARRGTSRGRSFLLLHDSLEIAAHLRNVLARYFHLSVVAATEKDVEFRKLGIFLREIVAEVTSPAFLSLERGTRDRLRDGEEVCQIERGVPAGIVFAAARHRDFRGAAL